MNTQFLALAASGLVALTVPVAAHNDPSPWQFASSFPSVQMASDEAVRVSGAYYAASSPLLEHQGATVANQGTSFTFGVARMLCDRETVDGILAGPGDEPEVDGVATAGLMPTTFNDGGVGGVCHTHSGFYFNNSYNTPGCEGYGPAFGEDSRGTPVWLTTVCDYGRVTSGLGQLSYAVACTAGVSPFFALDVADCAANIARCLAFNPTTCPLDDGYECGADASGSPGGLTAGQSGWGGDGVAFEEVPAPCADWDGAVAVYVWTAVHVDSVQRTHEEFVPTVGVIF